MEKFLKKPHSVVPMLMQINYSYVKILKLKIRSLFLVVLFCAHVIWWQDFTTLVIHAFWSLSFSTQNSTSLLLVSLKSPLNWPKIRNGLLLQNKQIVKRGNLVTGIKIFTWNNLIICIVLIWYLPILNLLSFLPVLMHSR